MAQLTIYRDGKSSVFPFSGEMPLRDALEQSGFALAHPCGGRGTCGKCAVTLSGAVSAPNAAEQRAGVRLSCQAVLLGDAQVILPDSTELEQIETAGAAAIEASAPMEGRFGAAVDIGTTTLALKLCELSTGRVLSEAGMRNPQASVAADVMGRIQHALEGGLARLQSQVLTAIRSLLSAACRDAQLDESLVDVLVLTGNTTMLYLLTGRSPESLAHAPFRADTLFGVETTLLGRRAYLPHCMNAFVGADITCAVLSSGMCEQSDVALLCDVGTNGEIALWKDGVLYVTSTAAGPAFEGAGISCGCGSVRGAVDKAWIERGAVRVHTIGDAPAVGVCGSGLIDLIAAFLQTGDIDETGAIEEDALRVDGGVALSAKDVRCVQLAKAAIAAGIETLLETAGGDVQDVRRFYIAGGFGSHLNIASAVRIGLIPEALASRVQVIGNAALSGALQMLLNRQSLSRAQAIAQSASHLNLGGNPSFNEHYIDQMFFPEEEE